MARKGTARTPKKAAILGVYYDFDLTGGGPPFGHVRAFHVELTIGKKTIVRNASSGEKLKRMVERKGRPVSGSRKLLPEDRGYSSKSYERLFTLPTELTVERIESEVPFESVL